MGWISDDGTHEGYLSPMLRDGSDVSGWKAGGLLVRRDDGTEAIYPGSEVVGWRVCCDCYSNGERRSTWHGQRYHRVDRPELDDLVVGAVYATDEDALFIDDGREDLVEAFLAEWRAHVEAADAEKVLRDAADAVFGAQAELDQAVKLARAAGVSWERIGRLTGMRRQSAHERWAHC